MSFGIVAIHLGDATGTGRKPPRRPIESFVDRREPGEDRSWRWP